jgi:triacylglycerol lipase
VAVRLPYIPPIWRESLAGVEAAALLRSSIWRGEGMVRGDDRPVLLVPGFLAGDGSLTLMRGWLRRSGYWAVSSRIQLNVDCATATLLALEERVERLAAERRQRVAIVGQSRGGMLARALAVRRPELVSGIVTLGSPQTEPLAVHPLVIAQVGAVAALGRLGVRGVLTGECLRGSCCAPLRATFASPFPGGVGYMTIYSRRDGIVDWRVCVDPASEQVEVAASHIGMAFSAPTYNAIARGLAGFADADAAPLAA